MLHETCCVKRVCCCAGAPVYTQLTTSSGPVSDVNGALSITCTRDVSALAPGTLVEIALAFDSRPMSSTFQTATTTSGDQALRFVFTEVHLSGQLGKWVSNWKQFSHDTSNVNVDVIDFAIARLKKVP